MRGEQIVIARRLALVAGSSPHAVDAEIEIASIHLKHLTEMGFQTVIGWWSGRWVFWRGIHVPASSCEALMTVPASIFSGMLKVKLLVAASKLIVEVLMKVMIPSCHCQRHPRRKINNDRSQNKAKCHKH